MKTVEKVSGLSELSLNELEETNGGSICLAIFVGALIVGAIATIIDNNTGSKRNEHY